MRGRFAGLIGAVLLVSIGGRAHARMDEGTLMSPMSGRSQAQVNQNAMVKLGRFCQGLQNTMTTLAVRRGVDPRQATQNGARATTNIFTQLKSGNLNIYFDMSSMDANPQAAGAETAGWVSLPEVLVQAMGRDASRVLYIEQANDLRFSPQVEPESHVLLLATNAGDVNADRSRKVARSAQALGVKISVIWVGKGSPAADLISVVKATGGAFLDLSHQNSCRVP